MPYSDTPAAPKVPARIDVAVTTSLSRPPSNQVQLSTLLLVQYFSQQ